MTTPAQALDRLRAAAATDELAAFCGEHGIELLVVFGSVTDPAPLDDPHELDAAVLLEEGADSASVVAALMTFTGCSAIDLLDLRRAGPVARARALGPGSVPLHETRSGTYARAQMAALAHELDTRWMRDLGLELLSR